MYWRDKNEGILEDYEAARDDFARALAAHSNPPVGFIAVHLYLIGGIVGALTVEESNDAAQAFVDAFPRLCGRDAERYFRELTDEVFDAKISSVRRELDPDFYAPTHHADVAALLEKYTLAKGVTP
jgi:hypothetical protein